MKHNCFSLFSQSQILIKKYRVLGIACTLCNPILKSNVNTCLCYCSLFNYSNKIVFIEVHMGTFRHLGTLISYKYLLINYLCY